MPDLDVLYASYQKKVAKAGTGSLRNVSQFGEWLAEVEQAAVAVVRELQSEVGTLRSRLTEKDNEIAALQRSLDDARGR